MSNRLKLPRVRPREMVPVQLNGEVRQQIEAVEYELGRLDLSERADRRLSSKSKRQELEAELGRLYEAASSTVLWLVLEGMQRTPYRALVKAHPARLGDDGKPILEDRGGVNTETFVPPLIRACVIGYREQPDPEAEILPLPDGELDQLLEEFCTDGQVDAIGATAIRLCSGRDADPLRRRRLQTPTSAAE